MSQPPSRYADRPSAGAGPLDTRPTLAKTLMCIIRSCQPTDPRPGIRPWGRGSWIADGLQPADPRPCGGAAC